MKNKRKTKLPPEKLHRSSRKRVGLPKMELRPETERDETHKGTR